VTGRWMAVDNRATTGYLVGASGLSAVSLAVGRSTDRITLAPKGTVNAATYGTAVAPGGLISIFCPSMADNAVAGSLPLPINLGGSCVTFNDAPIPLLMTSSTQINAQVQPNLKAGNYAVIVRSSQNALASNQIQVTVAAAAPGIFVNGSM